MLRSPSASFGRNSSKVTLCDLTTVTSVVWPHHLIEEDSPTNSWKSLQPLFSAATNRSTFLAFLSASPASLLDLTRTNDICRFSPTERAARDFASCCRRARICCDVSGLRRWRLASCEGSRTSRCTTPTGSCCHAEPLSCENTMLLHFSSKSKCMIVCFLCNI